MKPIFLASAIIIGSLYTTGRSNAELVDRVVAKVNSDIITLSEVRERKTAFALSRQIEGEETNMSPFDIKEDDVLNSMIEDKLKLQYASEKGIKVEEEHIYSTIDDIKKKNSITDEEFSILLKRENVTMDEYKKRMREQMIISQLMNSEISRRILIDEEEIKKYYDLHKDAFMQKESIKEYINVYQILFLKKEGMTEDIKKKAEEIWVKVKNGADFTETGEGVKVNNLIIVGETGFFEKGTMFEKFEEIAFSLKEGEVGELFESDKGFHIIKVTGRKSESSLSFEEISDKVKGILFEDKMKERYSSWIKKIKENSYVDIINR